MTSPRNLRIGGRLLRIGFLAATAIMVAIVSLPAQAQTANAPYATMAGHHVAANCECPGCRAFFDACAGPYPGCGSIIDSFDGSQGGMIGPDGTYVGPQGQMGSDAEASDQGAAPDLGDLGDFGDQSNAPMPGLSSSLGAVAVSASAAPNMIGDFFGSGFGQSFITLDRVFVVMSDIDALVPSADLSAPFTASESPSAVAVATGFDASNSPTGIIRVVPGTAQFTTVGSTAEVAQQLTANPDANIAIVNNGAYQSLAHEDLVARNGGGGQTEFNSAESYAQMQDSGVPPSGLGNGEDYDAVYAYDYRVEIPIGPLGGAPGANVGRQKMGENGSSIPRDRIINNFSYYDNTPLQRTGQDVVRNVSGFEKTFFDGMTSLEFRVPYASTLDSAVELDSNGIVGGTNGELGNMTLYAKLLLLERGDFALGAGLGVAMPTANDFVVNDSLGTEVLRVESESTHLLPYVGIIWAPAPNWFYQGFLQFDVDTRGNEARVSSFENGVYTGNLSSAGRLRDADLIYVDASVGYWMYQDERSAGITGFAPIFELHYNGSIDDGDSLLTETIRSEGNSSFDLVNAVTGAVVQFGGNKNIMFGYAVPIGGDEQFDGEFRMNLNWYFGASAQRNARRGY